MLGQIGVFKYFLRQFSDKIMHTFFLHTQLAFLRPRRLLKLLAWTECKQLELAAWPKYLLSLLGVEGLIRWSSNVITADWGNVRPLFDCVCLMVQKQARSVCKFRHLSARLSFVSELQSVRKTQHKKVTEKTFWHFLTLTCFDSVSMFFFYFFWHSNSLIVDT